MKRVFLFTIFFVIVVVSADAQGKGKFWLGGNFGFESTDVGLSASEHTFIIAPEFGYSFSDKWRAGIRVGYEQTKEELDGTGTIQAFDIAPFARYTFLKWKALSLFADGGFSYSRADGEIQSDGGAYSYDEFWGVGVFVRPGLSVSLSKSFSLVATANLFKFGYSAENSDLPEDMVARWAASLNSPFNSNNITLGFTIGF